METSAHLKLPYLMPSQAQKHVTHNEALAVLDEIVHLCVIDRDLTSPPAEPAEGDRHIVAPGGSGAWAGQDGRIAARRDGHWMIHTPQIGWLAWVADEARLLAWTGAGWAALPAAEIGSVPMVGVNATADTTNRLAVNAAATLLSHDGEGHQLKINKASAPRTASLLYQTNWSGRAEMGIAGDDDFHVKVSPNGTDWTEALVLDRAHGRLGLGTGSPEARLHGNVSAADDGRALLITGQGRTGADDPDHGALLALPRNVSDDRQIFLGDSETGAGIRVTGSRIDGYDFATGTAQDLALGSAGTGVTVAGSLQAAGPLGTAQWARVGSFTVAGLPSAATAGTGAIVFVSDAAGGSVLAFSDGAAWRRTTDRSIVG